MLKKFKFFFEFLANNQFRNNNIKLKFSDILKLIDFLEETNNEYKKVQEEKHEMKIIVESLNRENK